MEEKQGEVKEALKEGEARLEQKSAEIADARVVKTESPLEEARRLNTETKELMATLQKEKKSFDGQKANWELQGRADAGQVPQTQEEIDQAAADKILDIYK